MDSLWLICCPVLLVRGSPETSYPTLQDSRFAGRRKVHPPLANCPHCPFSFAFMPPGDGCMPPYLLFGCRRILPLQFSPVTVFDCLQTGGASANFPFAQRVQTAAIQIFNTRKNNELQQMSSHTSATIRTGATAVPGMTAGGSIQGP